MYHVLQVTVAYDTLICTFYYYYNYYYLYFCTGSRVVKAVTALLFSLSSYSLATSSSILAQATCVCVLSISVLFFIICTQLPCLILLKHTILTSSVSPKSGLNLQPHQLLIALLLTTPLFFRKLSSNFCQP